MVKKIISFFVAVMLLSVTVFASVSTPVVLAQETSDAGETKTYPSIYNTALGTTEKEKATGDETYEAVRYYNATYTTGKNSNKNESNTTGSAIAIGHNDNGEWVSFLRFPLSYLEIPADESVTKVELLLRTKYRSSGSDTGTWTVNAYGGFTDVAFGTTLTYTKTFKELTANDKIAGSTLVNLNAAAPLTEVKIDVTEYVAGLIASDAVSADFCLAAPDATALLELASGSIKTGGHLDHKPQLVITTQVNDALGLPEIDTVANEGKTKIRMQTQSEVAFANGNCGLILGNNVSATYDVSCKTAGKYYFGVYTADRFGHKGTRSVEITVNSTTQTMDFIQPNTSEGYDTDSATIVPSGVNDSLYMNCVEVDLVAGKNTITIKSKSSNLGFAYVELTNYARANAGDTGKRVAEIGIELVADTQPTVTNYPTVVYKVYDSIADVPAEITSGNVAIQLSGAGEDVNSLSCSYIVVSYNSEDCIQDIEILSYPCYKNATRNIDLGVWSFTGVEYIKVFVLDATTLTPIATPYGVLN